MKKIFIIFTLILLSFVPSYAIQEDTRPVELKDIILQSEVEKVQETPKVQDIEIPHEKTFSEKVHDILTAEVEKTDTPYHLLSEIATVHLKKGPVESLHLWGAYQGQLGIHLQENKGGYTDWTEGSVNVGIDGKFRSGKEDFRLMVNLQPQHGRNFWQNLPADMYIATNRIPHHRIMFGNSRPPVGVEGGQSPYTLPFIYRSQISRTYGTVRKFGVRVQGNYDLIEYDLGGYSSDTYFRKFFPGVEFTGWVNLKPLGKTDGRYGKLKLGGGINGGQYGSGEFFVAGAYADYEYKKFFANFEWAQADGSNGVAGYTDKQTGGFYSTIGYRITPKIEVLARYDQFDPDRNIGHNMIREYTAGINYYVKGQGLKLIFNYIFCQNQGANDSHRFMIGTQVLL